MPSVPELGLAVEVALRLHAQVRAETTVCVIVAGTADKLVVSSSAFEKVTAGAAHQDVRSVITAQEVAKSNGSSCFVAGESR